MRLSSRFALSFVLGFALLLVVTAPGAFAESISGGEVYGVFVQGGGTFGSGGEYDSSDSYTVVRFVEYAESPASDFPFVLAPSAFPSYEAGLDAGALGLPLGGEFFLIGSLTGSAGDDDHLLVSIADAQPWQTPSFTNTTLHDDLIVGAMGLSSGDAVVTDVSASDFWDIFAENSSLTTEEIANAFFGIDFDVGNGPVTSLAGGSYNFDGGSEDLFGFVPDFYNPNYTGRLEGGSNLANWRDGEGTLTQVPEPASLALLGGALSLGFGLRRRKRRAA